MDDATNGKSKQEAATIIVGYIGRTRAFRELRVSAEEAIQELSEGLALFLLDCGKATRLDI